MLLQSASNVVQRNCEMEAVVDQTQPIPKRSGDIDDNLNNEAKKAKSLDEVIN